MIYCVWYPSGGFGHFINAVLTLRGKNFVRPQKSLEFSPDGNSHNLDLVVPKYLHECWPGGIEFLSNKNYCVLVDNGINNESSNFKNTFPNSTVIKVCYGDRSWPVVARTMIDKAMASSIEQQLPIDSWDSTEPWVRREKYFLYLRDHNLRHAWRPENEHELKDTEIDVGELYASYEECFTYLNAAVRLDTFEDLWDQWRRANATYIDPVQIAEKVLSDVITKQNVDLTYITDIWTQAVIYYYIWLKYKIEVPHNDFADFFTSTEQIIKLVK